MVHTGGMDAASPADATAGSMHLCLTESPTSPVPRTRWDTVSKAGSARPPRWASPAAAPAFGSPAAAFSRAAATAGSPAGGSPAAAAAGSSAACGGRAAAGRRSSIGASAQRLRFDASPEQPQPTPALREEPETHEPAPAADGAMAQPAALHQSPTEAPEARVQDLPPAEPMACSDDDNSGGGGYDGPECGDYSDDDAAGEST